MTDFKLKDLIGFDRKTGRVTLGTHGPDGNEVQASAGFDAGRLRAQVDELLGGISGWSPEDHTMLAQTIVEPIRKMVPYVEMYNLFFQMWPLDHLEDNSIPIEDTVTIAWETHPDGAARYVRPGYLWTRPEFREFDTALDLPWRLLKKSGWNVFARSMERAIEDLARKRDGYAADIFGAALIPSHVVTVPGGLLTKAAINTVVKGSATIGMPVTQALVNPGTLKDFADFTWPVGVNLPDARVEQLLTNLYLSNYAGIAWHVNPHFPPNLVRFSGPPSVVGWHQTRGAVKNSSAVDITNKRDLYLIEDQEHAWYIGNDLTLWEIRIT